MKVVGITLVTFIILFSYSFIWTEDAQGLSLSSATVSVTDSLNIAQTALTAADGTYTISNITQGTFSGSIAKVGYYPYNFSNTMSPGQTITINASLSPVPPAISNIAVSNITNNSATITWTTDQPSDSLVEYGTTTTYDNSQYDATFLTNHSITLTNLSMGTMYHFKVTSKNNLNVSSSSGDNTFTTYSPITLTITSPLNGDTMNKSDVMVKGAVTNSTGNETGVTVNGMVATVYGTQFIANNIPLADGLNTITVTATDTAGNTATTSITVNAVTTGNYIELSANPESGISPLEVTLKIDGSFSITNSTITYTGPAQPETLYSSADEYRLRLTTEGVYYFTANVTGPDSNVYQDTVAVVVLNQITLDALLRAKWEGMKTALANQDVNTAMIEISENAQEMFRYNFELMQGILPTIVQDMGDITMIRAEDGIVEYEMISGGQSYYIEFVKDTNGIWMIKFF